MKDTTIPASPCTLMEFLMFTEILLVPYAHRASPSGIESHAPRPRRDGIRGTGVIMPMTTPHGIDRRLLSQTFARRTQISAFKFNYIVGSLLLYFFYFTVNKTKRSVQCTKGCSLKGARNCHKCPNPAINKIKIYICISESNFNRFWLSATTRA